jgi:hypothetical protein
MTTAEQMLAEEARQDFIVARAEAMLSDLLGRLSAHEALVALVGDAPADILIGVDHGDELMALQKQVLRMAEKNEDFPPPRTEPQG